MKISELCHDTSPIRLKNNAFFRLVPELFFCVGSVNVWLNMNVDVLKHLQVYHLHLPRHEIEQS